MPTYRLTPEGWADESGAVKELPSRFHELAGGAPYARRIPHRQQDFLSRVADTPVENYEQLGGITFDRVDRSPKAPKARPTKPQNFEDRLVIPAEIAEDFRKFPANYEVLPEGGKFVVSPRSFEAEVATDEVAPTDEDFTDEPAVSLTQLMQTAKASAEEKLARRRKVK